MSEENQGNIDRSNLMYAPDITYHMQEVLHPGKGDSSLSQDAIEAGLADIWLLTLHTQQVENASGQTAEESAYYRNLMYASYYNSLYGGGYGGSYGNSYSNYYSYMMMAQMMAAQNQTTYTTTTELDKDRFYKAILDKGGDPDKASIISASLILPFDMPEKYWALGIFINDGSSIKHRFSQRPWRRHHLPWRYRWFPHRGF